jgi:RES domain
LISFHRVFPWNPKSPVSEPGGAFFIPRSKQGQGRHDLPDLDGVLYCSRHPVSAIAEFIQGFRGQRITAIHLERPDGLTVALVHFTLSVSRNLINLDDPDTLAKLKIPPSKIWTSDRRVTRDIARRLYLTGAKGLLWPSALESSWINASLFESRTSRFLSVVGKIRPLTLDLPDLLEAANILGVAIGD